MKKLKHFFTAVGLVLATAVVVIMFIAFLYISYILAIGALIALAVYIVYKLLRASSRLEDTA